MVNSKVNRVSVERLKEGPSSGLKVKIDIKDIGGKGEDLAVAYSYSAEYADGVGKLTVEGEIVDRLEKKAAEEARKSWKDKKEISSDYKMALMNYINYVASIEGVVAARIVRLPPPMAPPRIMRKE